MNDDHYLHQRQIVPAEKYCAKLPSRPPGSASVPVADRWPCNRRRWPPRGGRRGLKKANGIG